MTKISPQLIAFDLDGTLAQSKQPMQPALAKMLISLLEKRKAVAIVTGGKYELIEQQVLQPITNELQKTLPKTPAGKKRFEKLFANLKLLAVSGTQYFAFENGTIMRIWEDKMSIEERFAAIEALVEAAADLGFLARETAGNAVEDRIGQVSFSALGQSATISAKKAWDPDGTKRAALAKATQKIVPHLEVRPGGASTVDVTSIGTNKGSKIKKLAASLGIPLEKIVYFGDKFGENGNDLPVAEAGITTCEVKNPADTLKQVQKLFS